MPLMSGFMPPSQEDHRRIVALVKHIRCFDRNGGKSFDLPTADPHGRPLTLLSRDELRSAQGWCMLPEYHEAIEREIQRRASIPSFCRPYN